MNSILKQMFEEIITYGNEFYEIFLHDGQTDDN